MATDSSVKINSLLKILRILNSGERATPNQLMERLGVSERTLYRYMNSLQDAGYPIFFDRNINSYSFIDGYKLTEHRPDSELFQALDLKSRMIGSVAVGLLSFDQSGQCIVANEHAASIVGGTREQLLQQNFYELKSWERSGLLLAANKVMKSGTEFHGEFHLLSSFGLDIWLLVSLSRYEQVGNFKLLVVFQNITAAKSAEENFRKLALRFQILADTTLDVFWTIGADGQILEFNDRACDQYGYSREELSTKNIKDIEVKESEEEIRLRIERLLANGYERFIAHHRKKDGTVIEVEVSAAHIAGTVNMLAFVRDISGAIQTKDKQHTMEKELVSLRQKIKDLEKQLSLRTLR